MTIRICFFGDSFVNGTGDDECLGWVGRLCSFERKLGANLTSYNLGIRRDTSQDVHRRWEAEAAARLPEDGSGRLVFSFGTNDSGRAVDGSGPRLPTDDAIELARSMLTRAASWLPCLVVGPLAVTADIERNAIIRDQSERMRGVCERLDIPFLSTSPLIDDIYDLWRAEALLGDGMHPNASAYAALAGTVRDWPSWRSWFTR